jgi:hypothetical protein
VAPVKRVAGPASEQSSGWYGAVDLGGNTMASAKTDGTKTDKQTFDVKGQEFKTRPAAAAKTEPAGPPPPRAIPAEKPPSQPKIS